MSKKIEQLSRIVDTKVGKLDDVKRMKKTDSSSIPYSKLFQETSNQERLFLYLGWVAAACTGFGLPSFIFLIGDVIDSFGPTVSKQDALIKIRYISLVFTLIGIAIWFTSFIFYGFLLLFSEIVARRTRVSYLRQILKQDCQWFDVNNYQELPSRINQEIVSIQKAVGEKMGVIIFACFMCISGLFFGLTKGWSLGLVILGMFPLIAGGTHFTGKYIQQGFAQSLLAYGQSAGYAEQALNAIKVVTAFGQQRKEEKNYSSFLEASSQAQQKKQILTGALTGYFLFAIFFSYSYSFFFGAYWIYNDFQNSTYNRVYSAGDVLSTFFGIIFGLFSLGIASPNFQAIAEGKAAAATAFSIIDRVPEIKLDENDNQGKFDLKGKIEFKNVTFYYPSRPDQLILNDFSCTIQAGKTTAIVGPSGSGKSTVVQLIERFYDPNNGQVLIDDVDIKKIHLRNFRQNVGYVSQEPILFNTTIKENLKLGKQNATDEEIETALKKAMAWEFVSKHKEGIDLHVGNAGGQMSGGQKQRLAIARAFIKKPQILLLDEATSALDKQNEKNVQESIDNIRYELGFVTTVVIAHRLSTIKNADEIIVMQKGRIVEKGNHDSLLKNYPNGTYALLVKQQENAESNDYNKQKDIANDFQEIVEIIQDIGHKQEDQKKSQQVSKKLSQKKVSDDYELKSIKNKEQEVINDMDIQKANEANQRDEENEKNNIKKKLSFFDFIKKLSIYSKPGILVFIGSIMSCAQGSTMPIFGLCLTKAIFSMQYPDKQQMKEKTQVWIIAMLCISIGCFICVFIYRTSFAIIASNITKNMRQRVYNSFLKKHMGWYDDRNNSPGVLTGVLSQDVQTLNGVSSEGVAVIIEANSSIIVGLTLGFYYCWQISLVALGCFPIMVLGGLIQGKFQQGYQDITNDETTEANLLANDAILNYKTVQSFANEQVIIDQFDRYYDIQFQKGKKTSLAIGFIYGFSQFTQNVIFALLYWAGAELQIIYPEMNGMDLFIGIFCIFYGAMAAGQANQFGPDLAKSFSAGQKVFEILDKPSEINPLENQENKIKIVKKDFKGTIEFKDVWFRYPSRKNEWVFKGLNLKINQNDTIAIVGESGCGKSTFTNLILRFYDVDFGQILIDGVNIKEYDVQDLRMQMGMVMQEPTLFNYSVKENILYGYNDAKNSQIVQSAQIANVLEFLESSEINNLIDDNSENLEKLFVENQNELVKLLGQNRYDLQLQALQDQLKKEKEEGFFQPVKDIFDDRPPEFKDCGLIEGFNIVCGMKGNKLSGGQKQRIAIARSIIREPSILILDEATSALDENSQAKVQKALENIMVGRTSIVIAHRLTTVEKCSRLAVIQDGVIVEEGTFDQLKNSNGYFKNLSQGLKTKTDK